MLHERENIDLFCCPKTHFVKNDRKGGVGRHTHKTNDRSKPMSMIFGKLENT